MTDQLDRLWQERYARQYRPSLPVDTIRRQGQRRRVVRRVTMAGLATLVVATSGLGLWTFTYLSNRHQQPPIAGQPSLATTSAPPTPSVSATPSPSNNSPMTSVSAQPSADPAKPAANLRPKPASSPLLSTLFPALGEMGWPLARMSTVKYAAPELFGCPQKSGTVGTAQLTIGLNDGARELRLVEQIASPKDSLAQIRSCQESLGEQLSAPQVVDGKVREVRWTSTTSSSKLERYADKPVVTTYSLLSADHYGVLVALAAPGTSISILQADAQGPMKTVCANVQRQLLSDRPVATEPSRVYDVDVSKFVQPGDVAGLGQPWTAWEYLPPSVNGTPSKAVLFRVGETGVPLLVRMEKVASPDVAAAKVKAERDSQGPLYSAEADFQTADSNPVYMGSVNGSIANAVTHTGSFVIWVISPVTNGSSLIRPAIEAQVARLR